MKRENAIRLAKLASANAWYGGSSALTLAKRATRLHPGSDAEEIVSRVYAHSRGRAVYTCPECDFEHLTEDAMRECCKDDEFYEPEES